MPGRKTQYARESVPRIEPRPDTNTTIWGDFWFACDRCFHGWQRTKLYREPYTGALVCQNCYDMPDVNQLQANRLGRSFMRDFYRYGTESLDD